MCKGVEGKRIGPEVRNICDMSCELEYQVYEVFVVDKPKTASG